MAGKVVIPMSTNETNKWNYIKIPKSIKRSARQQFVNNYIDFTQKSENEFLKQEQIDADFHTKKHSGHSIPIRKTDSHSKEEMAWEKAANETLNPATSVYEASEEREIDLLKLRQVRADTMIKESKALGAYGQYQDSSYNEGFDVAKQQYKTLNVLNWIVFLGILYMVGKVIGG